METDKYSSPVPGSTFHRRTIYSLLDGGAMGLAFLASHPHLCRPAPAANNINIVLPNQAAHQIRLDIVKAM